MNYIMTADLHIKSKRPQFRKDDYFKTVLGKFKQIISICNKHKADLIIAGDLFDSVKIGYNVLNEVIEILKELDGECYVVAGQHDMSFHRHSLQASPLLNLHITGMITILERDKPYFDGENYIYGCSFGQTPIKPKYEYNILVIHKSITPEEPPFYLTDAISAEQALDQWKDYSLIIGGDFHQPFKAEKYGNTLVNCGPMMRSSIDQMEIEPRVWLYDDDGILPIKLKIEPVENVFSLEDITDRTNTKFSKDLSELIDSLKDKSNKPNYEENVNLLVKEGNVPIEVENKINSILESVKNEE